MKTHDAIKKGLECCADLQGYDADCLNCPYNGEQWCGDKSKTDALTYIQQLESELASVKRERDALMHDLREARHCESCKHLEEKEELNKHYDMPSQCLNCISERSQHLWRGLCDENGGAENA